MPGPLQNLKIRLFDGRRKCRTYYQKKASREVFIHVSEVCMFKTKVFNYAYMDKNMWREWGQRQPADFLRTFGLSKWSCATYGPNSSEQKKIQLKSRGQVKFWKIKVSGCFASVSTARHNPENMVCRMLLNPGIFLLIGVCEVSGKKNPSLCSQQPLGQITKPLETAPTLLFLVLPLLLFVSDSSAAQQPELVACPGAVTGNCQFPGAHQSNTSYSKFSKRFIVGTWEKAVLLGWFRELK